mmetsp:Transcript_2822/g.12709  ORF Transcript_2822/g.12709 Transcript_2822/m.12709 type:complete len:200 (-) Transcript_2822:59-658(-)
MGADRVRVPVAGDPKPGNGHVLLYHKRARVHPRVSGSSRARQVSRRAGGCGCVQRVPQECPAQENVLLVRHRGHRARSHAARAGHWVQPRDWHQRPVLRFGGHGGAHGARRGVFPARARAGGQDMPRGSRGDVVCGAHVGVQRGWRGFRSARSRADELPGRHRRGFHEPFLAGSDMQHEQLVAAGWSRVVGRGGEGVGG